MAAHEEIIRELMAAGIDRRAAVLIAGRIGGASQHRLASITGQSSYDFGPAAGRYHLRWDQATIYKGDEFWRSPGTGLPLDISVPDLFPDTIQYPADAADHTFAIDLNLALKTNDPSDVTKRAELMLSMNMPNASKPITYITNSGATSFDSSGIDTVFSSDTNAVVMAWVDLLENYTAPITFAGASMQFRELY